MFLRLFLTHERCSEHRLRVAPQALRASVTATPESIHRNSDVGSGDPSGQTGQMHPVRDASARMSGRPRVEVGHSPIGGHLRVDEVSLANENRWTLPALWFEN